MHSDTIEAVRHSHSLAVVLCFSSFFLSPSRCVFVYFFVCILIFCFFIRCLLLIIAKSVELLRIKREEKRSCLMQTLLLFCRSCLVQQLFKIRMKIYRGDSRLRHTGHNITSCCFKGPKKVSFHSIRLSQSQIDRSGVLICFVTLPFQRVAVQIYQQYKNNVTDAIAVAQAKLGKFTIKMLILFRFCHFGRRILF